MKSQCVSRFVACVLLLSIAVHADAGWFWKSREAAAKPVTPPGWFGSYQETGVRIGFGQHADCDVAIANARKEIAEGIKVSVTSQTRSNVAERVDPSQKKSQVSKEFASQVQTRSDAVLTDSQIAKREETGGMCFVAVAYDDGDLPQRIFRRTRKDACPGTHRDDFMQHSPLAAEIRLLGGCTTALQLKHRSGEWMVVSGEQVFALRAGDSFERLIYTASAVSWPELSVKAMPAEITDGDAFQLQIQASDNGYVTLYNVFGNGFVTEVAGNIPVQGGTQRLFPDEKFGRELVGVLENKSVTTGELYVAIFSAEPITNEGHHLARSSVETSVDATTLDHLLTQMHGTRYAIATLKIRPGR